jgi:uncharacterized protein DUF1360
MNDRGPMGAYALLLAIFVVLVVLVAVIAGARLRGLPSVFDLTLAGLASYRITRVISQSKIGRVLRAPVTDPTGEEPRGGGMVRALGELVLCGSCFSVWVAAAISVALVAFPDQTRFIAFLFAAAAVAEFLLVAFERLQGE